MNNKDQDMIQQLKNQLINQYGNDVFDNIKMLLMRIESNYNNHFKNMTPLKSLLKLEDWCYEFHAFPKEVLLEAYRQYRSIVKEHPPTISHINEILNDMITIEDNIGPEKSFEKVLKLMQRYGSDSHGYERVKEQLSALELKIVTPHRLKQLGNSSTSIEILQAQYVKEYNDLKQREHKNKRIELNKLDSKKVLSLIGKKQFMLEE